MGPSVDPRRSFAATHPPRVGARSPGDVVVQLRRRRGQAEGKDDGGEEEEETHEKKDTGTIQREGEREGEGEGEGEKEKEKDEASGAGATTLATCQDDEIWLAQIGSGGI